MATNLGFDGEVDSINNITGSAVGWATAVRNLLIQLRSDNAGNPFGSAALVNTGTGNGNVPVLNASGDLADSVIPNLSAAKITTGTLGVARGGTGVTSLSALRTALNIPSTLTFDGNLSQDTFTLRSGSTTVAGANASIKVERGTSGTDAELRFNETRDTFQILDLNDSDAFKDILIANIDSGDRGKYAQVNASSNTIDWVELPEVTRNYEEEVAISLTSSQNLTAANDAIDKIVNVAPNAGNRVLTLTSFGSDGQGLFVRNTSRTNAFALAGLENITGNFTLRPGEQAEIFRISSAWILNDGFKPNVFSLNDQSINAADDADEVFFRDVSAGISRKITVANLFSGRSSGGGTTFTPSQANLYDSVKAIINGGTDQDSTNTIDIREVPALPTQNASTQWLRGDNTWASFPGVGINATEHTSFDAANDDIYYRDASANAARRIAINRIVTLRPEHTTAGSGNRNKLVKISSSGSLEFVDEYTLPSSVLQSSSAVNSFPQGLRDRLVPSTGTGVLKAATAGTFAFGSIANADLPADISFDKIDELPVFADGAEGQILEKGDTGLIWANKPTGGGTGGNIATGSATVRAADWTQKNAQNRFTDFTSTVTLPANYRDYEFVHVVVLNGSATTGDLAEASHLTEALENANTATPIRIGGGTDIFFNASTRAMTGASIFEVTLYNTTQLTSGGGLFASDDGSATIALGDGIHFTDASDSNNAKQTTFGSAINQFITRPDTNTSSSKQFVIRAASGTTYTRQTGLAAGDITSGILPTSRGGTGVTTGIVPRPVFAVTTGDRTIANSDYGQVIGINSDAADRTVTLPSSLDDEFMCWIFKDGSDSNSVTISIPGGNIVQGNGENLFTDNPDTVVLHQAGDIVKVHKLIPQNWWLVTPERIQRREVPYGGSNGQILSRSGTTGLAWIDAPTGGGGSFTPSQSNLFSAVNAIIDGGTVNTANNTIAIRQVPTLPVSNVRATRWLRGDNSWQQIPFSAISGRLTGNQLPQTPPSGWGTGGGGGGNGVELPSNAVGYLLNDGSGSLSWDGTIDTARLPVIPTDKGGLGVALDTDANRATARSNLGIDDYSYMEINTSRTITAADANTLFDVDTSGGSRTMTLPANPSDDIEIKFRKASSANTMSISPGSGDEINGSSSTFDVTGEGDIVTIRSIGTTGWIAEVSQFTINEVPDYPTSAPTTRYLRGDGVWATPTASTAGAGPSFPTLLSDDNVDLRAQSTPVVASNHVIESDKLYGIIVAGKYLNQSDAATSVSEMKLYLGSEILSWTPVTVGTAIPEANYAGATFGTCYLRTNNDGLTSYENYIMSRTSENKLAIWCEDLGCVDANPFRLYEVPMSPTLLTTADITIGQTGVPSVASNATIEPFKLYGIVFKTESRNNTTNPHSTSEMRLFLGSEILSWTEVTAGTSISPQAYSAASFGAIYHSEAQWRQGAQYSFYGLGRTVVNGDNKLAIWSEIVNTGIDEDPDPLRLYDMGIVPPAIIDRSGSISLAISGRPQTASDQLIDPNKIYGIVVTAEHNNTSTNPMCTSEMRIHTGHEILSWLEVTPGSTLTPLTYRTATYGTIQHTELTNNGGSTTFYSLGHTADDKLAIWGEFANVDGRENPNPLRLYEISMVNQG